VELGDAAIQNRLFVIDGYNDINGRGGGSRAIDNPSSTLDGRDFSPSPQRKNQTPPQLRPPLFPTPQTRTGRAL
jgi:hypothetical protein